MLQNLEDGNLVVLIKEHLYSKVIKIRTTFPERLIPNSKDILGQVRCWFK
jgi:hypothetical protein